MADDTVRVNCYKDGCGTFPMDRALYNRYQRTGETWHCPAGHAQHFTESTEQKLRQKIDELESYIDRLKDRLDRRDEAVTSWYEDFQAEKQKRREAEQRLLDALDPNGPVELYEDEWMWACRCGNTGRATFDTEAEARRAYGQHRDGHCDLDAPTATA